MPLYLLLLRLCINTHARINSVQFSTITFWLILHIILESQAAELPRILENTSWNRQNLSARIATTQVCDSDRIQIKSSPYCVRFNVFQLLTGSPTGWNRKTGEKCSLKCCQQRVMKVNTKFSGRPLVMSRTLKDRFPASRVMGCRCLHLGEASQHRFAAHSCRHSFIRKRRGKTKLACIAESNRTLCRA